MWDGCNNVWIGVGVVVVKGMDECITGMRWGQCNSGMDWGGCGSGSGVRG